MSPIVEERPLTFTDLDSQIKISVIVNRVLKTLEAYTISFIELGILRKEIQLMITSQHDLSPLVLLESICDLVKNFGVNSPITKLLHTDICSDINTLKKNEDLNTFKEIYWE